MNIVFDKNIQINQERALRKIYPTYYIMHDNNDIGEIEYGTKNSGFVLTPFGNYTWRVEWLEDTVSFIKSLNKDLQKEKKE